MEGRRSGQAFIQNAGKRVAVRACVDCLASNLLGSEVVERADELPCLGRGAAELLDQAEVSQVSVFATVEEHVPWLDVPVHEPALMGCVERLGDLAQNRNGPLGGERAFALEERLQVLTLHVAYRDEELSGFLARLVDGDDAPVVERGRQPRFAQKAVPEALVLCQLGRDQLQRDRPLEPKVGGAVDDAHPAASDEAFDPVVGEGRPSGELETHASPSPHRATT